MHNMYVPCVYISGDAQVPVLQLIRYTSSVLKSAKAYQIAQLLYKDT